MAYKFKLYFLLTLTAISLASCHKDDDKIEPPRDYGVQYVADHDSIKEYLQDHYLTVTEVNGLIDVTVTKITAPDTQISIWDDSRLDSIKLLNPNRKSNQVDGRVDDPTMYALYYLKLNEGGGDRPTVTDSVYCSYRGWTLDNEEFDRSDTPFWSTFPALSTNEIALIPGFREVLPKIKGAESAVNNGDGTWSFNNYGAVVAFLPSGLGYFNAVSGGIPAYSPLVFLIRLNQVKYRDHDRDRIPSNYENIKPDNTVAENLFEVDTDGDNIPDFLDIDDDNDTYSTKNEIRITPDTSEYYPFDLIPNCAGANKKRHLDANCH